MLGTRTDPIAEHWPTSGRDSAAAAHEALATNKPATDGAALVVTASEIVERLAQLEIAGIAESCFPAMAQAASELASASGLPSDITANDPPVAIVRLMTKAALMCPEATGPHTARLLTVLDQTVLDQTALDQTVLDQTVLDQNSATTDR